MKFLKFLQKARDTFKITRFLRKKSLSRAQVQLRNLKSEVDQLSRRLQSLELMTAAVNLTLSGSGPFCMPVLTRFVSLITAIEDYPVAEFETQDGKRFYLELPRFVATQLVNEPPAATLRNFTLDRSTLIEYPIDARSFRMPTLSLVEGYFYADDEVQVLVSSTENAGRLFIPLSREVCRDLVEQLRSAVLRDFPAKDTEVGVARFLHPICFQTWPRDENPKR